jgi:hypothetical protein
MALLNRAAMHMCACAEASASQVLAHDHTTPYSTTLPPGSDADYVEKLQGGLSGVMTWCAKVSSLSSEVGPNGTARQLAVVDLTSHRQVGTAVSCLSAFDPGWQNPWGSLPGGDAAGNGIIVLLIDNTIYI